MSAPCFCRHFRGTFALISVALCAVCRTALHVAGNSGSVEHLRVLLSAGANAKAETTAEHEGIPAGSTPLSVASQMGHSEVVAALVGPDAT